MIIDFSVKNYRSIKDEQTISFEATNSTEHEDYLVFEPELLYPRKKPLRLLKLNLIYGANGSGKSNLISALNSLDVLMRRPRKNKEEKNDSIVPFLFDSITKDQPTEIKISFIGKDKIIYEYELSIKSSHIEDEKLYSIENGKGLLFHRTTDIEKKISSVDIKQRMQMKFDDKKLLASSTLWNSTVLATFTSLNIENKYLSSVVNWVTDVLMLPIGPQANLSESISKSIDKNLINKKNVIDMMREADFCLNDFFEVDHEPTKDELEFIQKLNEMSEGSANDFIEHIKNKKDLFFVHKLDSGEYHLSYDDESLGTQRYFQLSGIMDYVTSKDKIIPIDEFESSLHPELVTHFLLKFMKTKHKSQMLITTHYREFLSKKDLFRKDCIWFIHKRRDDSSSELYSLSDFDTKTIRETSSVYNAYVAGKLGGSPNI